MNAIGYAILVFGLLNLLEENTKLKIGITTAVLLALATLLIMWR